MKQKNDIATTITIRKRINIPYTEEMIVPPRNNFGKSYFVMHIPYIILSSVSNTTQMSKGRPKDVVLY